MTGMFGIGELSRRTGVPVPTLRAWEQRHGLLRPARSPGGHRRYSPADVERVRAFSALVAGGLTHDAAARAAVTEAAFDRVLVPAGGGGSAAPPARGAPLETASAGRTDPAPDAPPASAAGQEALAVALRSLLWAVEPGEVVEAVTTFVEAIGGAVIPVADAEPALAIPVDVSFGLAGPAVPVAEEVGVARMLLEELLPLLVEDARHVLARFGR